MSNYPGEDTDIPKRIVDALKYQPLSNLVPKDGFSSMVGESLTASIPHRKSFNTVSKNITLESEIINNQKENINIQLNKDNNTNSILEFIRPVSIKISEVDKMIQSDDLFEHLSQAAKLFLKESKAEVKSDDIVSKSKSQKKTEKKHKLDDNMDPNMSIDLSDQKVLKRAKLSSNISINQESMGTQYMKDLKSIMEYIGKKDSDIDYDNLEYWIKLSDEQYVLTELCLKKLQIAMKNILNLPQLWDKLDLETLIRLLDVMVQNIRLIKGCDEIELESIQLKVIGYLSVNIVLIIFLFNKNDKSLYLEQYVLEPIQFITENLESLRLIDGASDINTAEIQLLDQVISLLPRYISQQPYLDDSLITKLIYVFSDLLMGNEIDQISNLPLQNSWSKIRSSCSGILISLFIKVPDQREFILDELLSHVDKLPQKRVQKRLRKVDGELFITDFTLTVLGMLENINYFNFLLTITDLDTNTSEALYSKQRAFNDKINSFFDHINDSILNKFIENTSKYRHCLENYVHDLIGTFQSCKWPVAEGLLTSLTKKLLGVFNSSRNYSSNVDTVCLQLLGHIGSSLFEVKLATKPEEANNLIKICNYPETLPRLLSSFKNCIGYIKANQGNASTWHYMWCLEISSLFRLQEFMKDANGNDSNVDSLIKESVLAVKNSVLETTPDNINTIVTTDYYSILHIFEILDLYEPYLKLILSILDKDKIKLRSTAIKCLSMLASKDQNVLSSPMVKSTINDLLSLKSAASVKDAVLDLVSIESAYLQFYKQININYDADSILVRKHILKINEKIYEETDSIEVKIYVASKVLLKLEDEEDTIIEMARNILTRKFILDLNEFDSMPERQTTMCEDIIQIMAGVIMTSDKCSSTFDWFLNFYLLDKTHHSDTVFNNIKSNLNLLTDILVQRIIELQSFENKDESTSVEKQRLLSLLAKFSDSVVQFITKNHIVGLYPYMVSDEKSELHFHILHTYKKSMMKLSNFKPKFLYDLETTLLTGLPKMNVMEMEEAIPLVWHVSKQRHDHARVAKACSSCFLHLNPYITKANKEPESIKLDSKLQRLIYLSTGFARFCSFNTSTENISFIQNGEPIYEYVAKCMLVLSKSAVTHNIRRISIKNLTKLCANHPRLFNSKHILALLDKEFSSDNLDIQLVILESFYDFFMLEEKQSIRRTGEDKYLSSNVRSKNKSKIISKREFLNDGICSALISRYLTNILKICRLRDLKSALVGIRLLRLILQYGYTNPSLCIPTSVALLSSTDRYMHHISEEILTDLFEKYESIIYNGLAKGIQLAAKYSKSILQEQYYRNDIFFNSLQKVLTSDGGQTTKFNNYINRITMNLFNSIISAPDKVENLEMIIFISTNITNIRFQTQFALFKLVKNIDLFAEQLNEAIHDETGDMDMDVSSMNSQTEEILLNINLKNTKIAQEVLKNLTSYLLKQYGLKDDILLSDTTVEAELKAKPALVVKAPSDSFVSIVENIIHITN